MRYGLHFGTHYEDRLAFETTGELILAKYAVEAMRIEPDRGIWREVSKTFRLEEQAMNRKADIAQELGAMIRRSIRGYSYEAAYFEDDDAVLVLDAIENLSAQPVRPLEGAAAYYNDRAMEMVATQRDFEQPVALPAVIPMQRRPSSVSVAS